MSHKVLIAGIKGVFVDENKKPDDIAMDLAVQLGACDVFLGFISEWRAEVLKETFFPMFNCLLAHNLRVRSCDMLVCAENGDVVMERDHQCGWASYPSTNHTCNGRVYGAEMILNRCITHDEVEEVYLLSDSVDDFVLADPCRDWQIPYQFWFVGNQADLTLRHRRQYNLRFPSTNARYTNGAIEALSQLL